MEYTSNGIMYLDDIVSSTGAVFKLFTGVPPTKEDILMAVIEIQNNRDMGSWQVATENDRDQLYITMIFRNPLIRAFRWYEINVPAELIRSERRKGTTVEQYIQKYVLDFRQKTKDENEAKYGEKIFEI
jgi:hypothetical protein